MAHPKIRAIAPRRKGDAPPAGPHHHEPQQRTLKTQEPDQVNDSKGIKCRIYQPLNRDRFAKYQQGIERLKEKVEARGGKIVFMTPPVYDKHHADFDYDEVMATYSRWLMGKRTEGWAVIDLHLSLIHI